MSCLRVVIGSALLLALASGASARPTVVVPPFHQYEVAFDGSGTYTADAVGVEAQGAYFASTHKELPFAWNVVFPVYLQDDQVPDLDPAVLGGTTDVTVSGTFSENGMSSRTSSNGDVPYSCAGQIGTFPDQAEISVARGLPPLDGSPAPFTFVVRAFSELVCPYPECECHGGYDAFADPTYLGVEPEHFTATVSLQDLTAGKVIFYVQSAAAPLEACTEDIRPVCSHTLTWTGHVTFTLLRDSRPPYVRPAAASMTAARNGRLSMPLTAAHAQMGAASGKVTLVSASGRHAKYGSARFKVADGQGTANVTVALTAGARRLLKKSGQLQSTAVVKAKDVFGTATVQTPVVITAQ